LAAWETQGQVYFRTVNRQNVALSPLAFFPKDNPGNRKHPVFALNQSKSSRLLMVWVEGTGWAKGGTVAWECIDLANNTRTSGREAGVPVWGLAAAFPERDGTFTILY
jgi:hypothetical protein